jgi:ABC-type glycerol-3-phosphate transport system permease component
MTSQGIQIGELSAAIIVISLPVVVITFAVRGHLVEGLSLGGFR